LGTVTNLQDAVTQVRSVVAGVSAGQGTLGKLVTDDTLYNATTASMTNLSQVLQKVNQGKGTVGKLVNDQEFYKNAKLSLQKLDKAADSLEDTGPLSVVGTIAGTLF
jgi:phospholipid/cholesterol/gamma-HCH transport system substrate-binding protein